MFNFLDPRLSPKVRCSSAATDNFEASNLISDKEAIRARGFLAYTVIKPPVELEFEFLCPINVSYISLNTTIGRQKCTGIELFAKTATSYVSIGKATYDAPGVTFCNSRAYSKDKPPPYHDQSHALFYLKSNTIGVYSNTSFVKLVIFRTNFTVPCLGSVKIFGTPARSCSKVTVNTIHRIMTVDRAKTEPVLQKSAAVPEDFLDALTMEIMAVPMTLPSGKSVDRDTLDKHVENEKSFGRKAGDPFTGLKFTESRKPVLNVALKSRIDMFLMQNAGNPIVQGVKRTVGGDKVNKKQKNECCSCQKCDNLYVLPCQHFYCRHCLLELTNFTCLVCRKLFVKSEPVRYHV